MPNSISAKKRLRQNVTRRSINRSFKSAMRTQLRKVREAVQAGDADTAEKEFRIAVKKLDQAGARNIIHANKAARTKSRLQKAIKGVKSAA